MVVCVSWLLLRGSVGPRRGLDGERARRRFASEPAGCRFGGPGANPGFVTDFGQVLSDLAKLEIAHGELPETE